MAERTSLEDCGFVYDYEGMLWETGCGLRMAHEVLSFFYDTGSSFQLLAIHKGHHEEHKGEVHDLVSEFRIGISDFSIHWDFECMDGMKVYR